MEIDGLGPDDTLTVGKENDFTVDTTKAGKGKILEDKYLIELFRRTLNSLFFMKTSQFKSCSGFLTTSNF